ncbi:MAG TPA: tetratricopeptide repeat protein [Trebonia sp.]|jgi:predicted Zn-dependent protease|nr:tetratricopeptide repeat protein [Trebonia sp.]
MSEGSSDSWDSPSSENFARQGGSQGRAAGETGGYRPPGRPSGPPEGRPEHRAPGSLSEEADGTDPAVVHAWYTSGMELLSKGSPAAAAQVLQRAANAEPGSRSVREALARAQFDTGQYTAAAGNFRVIVEASPTDDYAHFGLGLSLARAGNHTAAAEYLALAAAMRPDRKHYTDALRQVRATLKFRGPAGGGQPQEPPAG